MSVKTKNKSRDHRLAPPRAYHCAPPTNKPAPIALPIETGTTLFITSNIDKSAPLNTPRGSKNLKSIRRQWEHQQEQLVLVGCRKCWTRIQSQGICVVRGRDSRGASAAVTAEEEAAAVTPEAEAAAATVAEEAAVTAEVAAMTAKPSE